MSNIKAQQAKAEAEKAEAKKCSLLSQLKKIREELLIVQSDINELIQHECGKTVARFESELYKTVNVSLLGNDTPFPKTVTLDISSLSDELLKLKQKREEVFQQQLMIHGLMQNISSSEPIEDSKLKMKIIAILSVKSFLESQTVAMLREMINLCPSIRECLQLLETYSEKYYKGMKYGPNEDEHPDEDEDEDESIPKKIDPKTMLPFHQNLDTLFRQLTELQQKIDEIKAVFSEGYSIDSLFSGCRVLSSLCASSRQLQDELEQTTLDFQTFRNKVVKFFESEFNIRKNHFIDETVDDTFYSTFHTQFNEIDKQMEEALKIIK